jgi:lipid-A-disaccharide synthase
MGKSIYIIAGEHSGDLIGSRVIASLREIDNDIIIHGVGGPLMIKEDFTSLFDMNHIGLMGFIEIIPNLFKIIGLISKTVEDICSKNPDIVVTIDSPGFCYRVVSAVKRLRPDIKTLHIVAPSVWAYKPKRANKFAKVYDHLLTLFPFEPKYFQDVGMEATCIGHPALEQDFINKNSDFRKAYNIRDDQKLIVVTPGSRLGEIKRHLPVFIPALDLLSEYIDDMVVCFVTKEHERSIKGCLKGALFRSIIVGDNERLRAYSAADLALAKSGTNTLELSASKIPIVIAYKMHPITFLILKAMIKIKYASIVNIIADKAIIPEFIQFDCTVINLFIELKKLLQNKNLADIQVQEALKILRTIGFEQKLGASKNAAKIIMKVIESKTL